MNNHEHEHNHEHDHNHEHEHEHEHEHKHEHNHDHDHNHEHEHEHKHEHNHEHEHKHEHEHNHNHEHKHDHEHEGCCGEEHLHDHDSCCSGEADESPEPTRSHTHFEKVHVHTPGHPDDCDCLECNPHAEYCDICSESLAKCTCRMPDENLEKQVYILEGIDCANCAAKIEAKVKSMPEVAYVSVSFATKQLRVSARDQAALLPKMQAAIDAIEDGITLVPRNKKITEVTPSPTADKEGHGHDHGHDHSHGEGDEKKTIIMIAVGALLFVAGIGLEHLHLPVYAVLPVLIIAYLILGGKVLLAAGKNILKGQVFDENFLMSIATIGAFLIGEYPEAVGVMLFFRIGEFFEDRAVEKSRKQIMDAVDLRPEVINLVVGEEVRVVKVEAANVGDILLVRPGDRIPLDGVIIEGESRIDTSAVTGEPVPVKAAVGDNVTSGCVNTSGQLKIRVEKLLEDSMVTRILDAVENAAANKPAIDKFITRFARIYTPIVVGAALVVAFILPLIIPSWHFFVDPSYMGAETVINGASGTASILTALTFLVISCPCALVLSVPLAFFSGIGCASKKGILFKGGGSIEALSKIKAIVMDKTGTITKGNFAVQKEVPAGDLSEAQLLSVAASCEMFSTHPIAVSIVNAAKEKGLEIEKPTDLKEIAGHGIEAKLTSGTVLCGNRKLMEQYKVDLSAYEAPEFGTEVLVAVNGAYSGNIVISDTLKEDAVDAIGKIRKLGIVTAMLTGDAESSAEFVAAQTGIDEIHARLLPENKLSELMTIREKHGSVMFVGDGINDAPVLAGADVGAAMGSGADAAIEAADVVFMNSEMDAIPKSVDIAKATSRISWQNVWFALIIKLVVMVLGLCGFANMWVAVLADTGVSVLCLLNSIRILRK